MRDFQTQLRQLKDQGNESKQKLLNLEKTVYELSKKKLGVKLMVCLLVLIGLVLLIWCILEADCRLLQRKPSPGWDNTEGAWSLQAEVG